jgi:hypothetical protein
VIASHDPRKRPRRLPALASGVLMLVLIGGGSGAPSAGAQSPPTTHLDALAHIGRTLSDHLGLEASRKL